MDFKTSCRGKTGIDGSRKLNPELESVIMCLISQALDAAVVVDKSGANWGNQIRTTCDILQYHINKSKGHDIPFSRHWSTPEAWDIPGQLPTA